MTTKAKRKVSRKQATVGEPRDDAGDRKVYREADSKLLALVNPPLSRSAIERIERLEAASANMGQRLGRIRMN